MTTTEREAFDAECAKSPVQKRNDQSFTVLKQRIPSAKQRLMSAGKVRPAVEVKKQLRKLDSSSSGEEMAI